jgi:hypothetical protein
MRGLALIPALVAYASPAAAVWLTTLPDGAARKLPIPAGAGGVTMAPSEDRVCYFDGADLACVDLADDTVATIAQSSCGWGNSGVAAWSPSGRRLAFPICAGTTRDVAVHDFDDATVSGTGTGSSSERAHGESRTNRRSRGRSRKGGIVRPP